MDTIPPSLRELLATGPLAHVVTLDPDGTPHVTLAWAGFDGDEIVMATFYNLNQRKIQNMRRDPRVVLSFQAREYSGQGLWPYAVVQGRVREITGRDPRLPWQRLVLDVARHLLHIRAVV